MTGISTTKIPVILV